MSFLRLFLIFAVPGVLLINVLYLSVHWTRDLSLEQLLPTYASEASTFVEIPSARVHVRDEGASAHDTPPIVMLHGLGDSLHTFEPWVDRLESDFRVVRLDLPGFGLTGPFADDETDYGMANHLRFLRDTLDALDIERIDLLGHSLGGWYAWRFALAYPERVRRLVLVAAAGYPEHVGDTLEQARSAPFLRSLLRNVTPRNLIEQGLRDAIADDRIITDAMIDQRYDLLLRADNRDALALRLDVDWDDAHLRIPEITTPTLLMWGTEDHWIPSAAADNFAADLPDATLVRYDGIGHMPMLEAPDRSAEDLRRFLLADAAVANAAPVIATPETDAR
ncbi:MAG: alpha/beta hydrolase [Acidobacteriota bacterium]